MDVSTALLVALMFITILSIGIGNILTTIASILDPREAHKLDWLAISWIFLLLLQHLNLFWETLEIFSVKEWGFLAFLYIVSGPMLLLVANRLLLEMPDHEEVSTFSREHYRTISRRFFLLMALLMVWILGADLVLDKGITPGAIINLALLVLLSALVISRNERLHSVVTILVLLLTFGLFVSRGIS